MQCQILLVIHNWIQGNLEQESGNLSEVTSGFSPGTPAIIKEEKSWVSCLTLFDQIFEESDEEDFDIHFQY